jgi:hypothetical protein
VAVELRVEVESKTFTVIADFDPTKDKLDDEDVVVAETIKEAVAYDVEFADKTTGHDSFTVGLTCAQLHANFNPALKPVAL